MKFYFTKAAFPVFFSFLIGNCMFSITCDADLDHASGNTYIKGGKPFFIAFAQILNKTFTKTFASAIPYQAPRSNRSDM